MLVVAFGTLERVACGGISCFPVVFRFLSVVGALCQVFASIDTDGNGLLSYEEFSSAVKLLDLEPPLTRSETDFVMESLDSNGWVTPGVVTVTTANNS